MEKGRSGGKVEEKRREINKTAEYENNASPDASGAHSRRKQDEEEEKEKKREKQVER